MRVARSLTDKEIWCVVGSHIILPRYHPTLEEIRLWTNQADKEGAGAIGWFGFDFIGWSDKYGMRGLPTSINDPERWNLMKELSKKFMESRQETKRDIDTRYACLFSYDTIEALYSYFHILIPYVSLFRSNIVFKYLSDNSLLKEETNLEGCQYLFTTPCPSIRPGIAGKLTHFIKSGGVLVSSCDDFVLDEEMQTSAREQ